MKAVARFFLLIAALFFGAAFSIHADWFLYEADRYKISFPEKPDEETKKVPSQAGEATSFMLTYNATKNTEKNSRYLFSESAIASVPGKTAQIDADRMLEAAAGGAIRNHRATLISKDTITSPYPGRNLVMSMSEGKIIVTMKTMLKGMHYYGLVVYTPVNNKDNAEIKKFMESLILK